MPPIDCAAQENRVRAGLSARPSLGGGQATGVANDAASAFAPSAPTLDSMAHGPRASGATPGPAAAWSLNEPEPTNYLRAMVDGARMAQVCSFVELADIGRLAREVPVLRHAAPGTFVAFDLDDTLVRKRTFPSTSTSSGQLAPAQSGTVTALHDLQARHTCIGLTARPYDWAYNTYFKLEKLGIQFPGQERHAGPHATLHDAGSLGGVYYAGHRTPKGDLLATLRRDHPEMRHLVFVDDQPTNFVSMVDAAARTRGDFTLTCVHYTRLRNDHESRELWNQVKHVTSERATDTLRALDASDRAWRHSLSDTSDLERHKVTNLLAHFLRQTTPDRSKRLQLFLSQVREAKLLDSAHQHELQLEVNAAEVAAWEG